MRVLKSKLVFLLCVWILSTSVIYQRQVVAQTTRSTPALRQQVLVKRINRGALRFYKAFISQSVRTSTVDCELNDLLEDLLLAADSLTDSRFMQHNLIVVMQIASDVEEELLCVHSSSAMVIGWSRLHADLDRLARMNGIRWSEVVISDQLIAAQAGDNIKANEHYSPGDVGRSRIEADCRRLAI